MPVLIKSFPDGSRLEYDDGTFDAWCVYLREPDGRRHAPRDAEYFERFRQLAAIHGHERIHGDFVAFYEKTGRSIEPAILQLITVLSGRYGASAVEMDRLFTTVYAGMVAEENKERTILKKRIKRLGMHQTLMENLPAAAAANFSKGRPWRELDKECRQRGF